MDLQEAEEAGVGSESEEESLCRFFRNRDLECFKKMLDEQGFKGRIAGREDIKRLLAVYFEQNVTNEVLDDYDGERWVIGSGQERWTWGA